MIYSLNCDLIMSIWKTLNINHSSFFKYKDPIALVTHPKTSMHRKEYSPEKTGDCVFVGEAKLAAISQAKGKSLILFQNVFEVE